MYYIGIDIAKAEHVIGLADKTGKVIVEPFTVKNTAKGFEKMLNRFDKVGIDSDNAMIGMEATGHYWLVIFEFLTDHGFDVAVINPIQTDAFRNVTSIRKTKTDAID